MKGIPATELFVPFAGLVVGLILMWVAYWMSRKKRPSVGPFRFVIAIKERKGNGMDILTYKVGLPASKSGDVVKKVLTIKRSTDADGKLKMEEIVELGPKVKTIDIEAGQGSQVDLALVAIDDAGNKSSPPVRKTFQATDTIPPELSGEMTIAATDERTVPDEAPEEDADAGEGEEGETTE